MAPLGNRYPRYPLLLDLKGRRALVVGGGKVATRKVNGLLASGADVTVIAPRASADIQAMSYQGRIKWETRPFRMEDGLGFLLLFAATDERKTNLLVASSAKQYGALVNIADDPDSSDFHLPAVARRGDVTLALSTEGASPALGAWLRDRCKEALPEGVERSTRLLSGLRREVKESEKENSSELFRKLLGDNLVDDLSSGDFLAAEAKVDALFGEGAYRRAMDEH